MNGVAHIYNCILYSPLCPALDQVFTNNKNVQRTHTFTFTLASHPPEMLLRWRICGCLCDWINLEWRAGPVHQPARRPAAHSGGGSPRESPASANVVLLMVMAWVHAGGCVAWAPCCHEEALVVMLGSSLFTVHAVQHHAVLMLHILRCIPATPVRQCTG
jgi:hypothetical protein